MEVTRMDDFLSEERTVALVDAVAEVLKREVATSVQRTEEWNPFWRTKAAAVVGLAVSPEVSRLLADGVLVESSRLEQVGWKDRNSVLFRAKHEPHNDIVFEPVFRLLEESEK